MAKVQAATSAPTPVLSFDDGIVEVAVGGKVICSVKVSPAVFNQGAIAEGEPDNYLVRNSISIVFGENQTAEYSFDVKI